MRVQELKLGRRTPDHMLHSGRFVLIGDGFPGVLLAHEPIWTRTEDDSGSPLLKAFLLVTEALCASCLIDDTPDTSECKCRS